MLESLRKAVYDANMELNARNLVIYSFGNVSGIDRKSGIVAIKPSGVPYGKLSPENIILVNVADGKTLEGTLWPSSDTPTHLEIYRNFPAIGGITHSHSKFATVFAQAGFHIPCQCTTHADYFYGDIPLTRKLKKMEIERDYELNTGKVIVEKVRKSNREAIEIPAVLVAGHGPFTWGKTPEEAVEHAVILEYVAEMALHGLRLNNMSSSLEDTLLDRHFLRKHGKNAYYGQNKLNGTPS